MFLYSKFLTIIKDKTLERGINKMFIENRQSYKHYKINYSQLLKQYFSIVNKLSIFNKKKNY